jgi:hypothetical protein
MVSRIAHALCSAGGADQLAEGDGISVRSVVARSAKCFSSNSTAGRRLTR